MTCKSLEITNSGPNQMEHVALEEASAHTKDP